LHFFDVSLFFIRYYFFSFIRHVLSYPELVDLSKTCIPLLQEDTIFSSNQIFGIAFVQKKQFEICISLIIYKFIFH